jgi:hypothetical protein
VTVLGAFRFDFFADAGEEANEKLLCVMLEVALEEGTVLVEYSLELTCADTLALTALGLHVQFGYLLQEEFLTFLFVFPEVFLL